MENIRKATLGFILFFVFAVSGCSVPASPTQPKADSPTEISPTLTQTPLLTATKPPATPTITPEPGLRTNGPYFTYFREVNGEYQFVMMDADGVGRKVISIPIEIIYSLPDTLKALNTQFVSHDGKWLAVYTGIAGVSDVFPPQGKLDLTLSLYSFLTGELQVVAPLLSSNYPNNFKEAAERLNNPSITDVTLYQAFLNGITRSIAWSPDGRYLAFAGQMDGLSSDLYVYELETKNIRRLSRGDQEIQSVRWSSDSESILYSGAFNIGIEVKFDNYVAKVDGSSVKNLSASSSGFPMWVNSHEYLEYDNDYELGTIFGLRLVDINTGQIHKIWDGPVMNFGLNTEKTKLAFVTRMFAHSPYLSVDPDPNFVPGLYLMDLNTFTVTNVKVPDSFDFSESYFINSFDLNENLFVFTEYYGNRNPYLVSDAGELIELNLERIDRIIGSPDSNYWIAITNKTVDIYSVNNVLINSVLLPFQNPQTSFFEWRLDSSGLFAVQEQNVYYLNISTGEIKLIETNLVKPLFSTGYRWIIEK